MIPELDLEKVKPIVVTALEEDVGTGDITTERVIPANIDCTGVIIAKNSGVIAGISVAELVFRTVDKRIKIKREIEDGDKVEFGSEIIEISGWAKSILCAERVTLNFLSHMSGIATLARTFADKVKDYGVTILDTRKTMPGLRVLEKYAVRAGGGENHRMGLYDQVLIKDNHIKIQRELGPGYIHRAVTLAKKYPGQRVEVEVESIEEAREAVSAGADILMLDNLNIEDIREIAGEFHGKVLLEVSGGVTLNNIEEIAKTEVDYISIGALTHSAPALDLSLEIK